MLLCATFGEDIIILQILSVAYVVALNDLCDLGNDIKVIKFKLGLLLELVLPCTKFGEDTSNVSSDIEQNVPYVVDLNDLCDL